MSDSSEESGTPVRGSSLEDWLLDDRVRSWTDRGLLGVHITMMDVEEAAETQRALVSLVAVTPVDWREAVGVEVQRRYVALNMTERAAVESVYDDVVKGRWRL